MSRVVAVIPALAGTALARVSPCGGCSAVQYCDQFEVRCIDCTQVCPGAGATDWQDCAQFCPQFLHSAVQQSARLGAGDLHTLTIMVSLTAVMTCIVMVLILGLVLTKMQKRKKSKKPKVRSPLRYLTNPNCFSQVVPTSVYTVGQEKVSLATLDSLPRSCRSTHSTQLSRPSLSTQSTVLTQLSTQNSVGSVEGSHQQHSERRARRQAAEDTRPPPGGRNNPAITLAGEVV